MASTSRPPKRPTRRSRGEPAYQLEELSQYQSKESPKYQTEEQSTKHLKNLPICQPGKKPIFQLETDSSCVLGEQLSMPGTEMHFESTQCGESDNEISENARFTYNDQVFSRLYTVSTALGQGASGSVYLARHSLDNKVVAVKRINKHGIRRWARKNNQIIPLEVLFLRKLSHVSGVVKLLDHFESQLQYVMIFETTENSMDLHQYIRLKSRLKESEAKVYIEQVVTALLSCYEEGIAHCDIKPSNIVIDANTQKSVLIDFGNSEFTSECPIQGVLGTKLFSPPEAFNQSLYFSENAAVWAIGVTLYAMVTGILPFYTVEEIIKTKSLKFHMGVSRNCKTFIRRCLKKNPQHRLSLYDLLGQKFFQDEDQCKCFAF